MATANELLAMAADSGVDKTLIINNDLRTIIIPKSVTNLGVEADNDTHRLYFQMPRYSGDIDLSELNIRINYMNANKDGDIYVVTDKKVLSSTITFSWLVGPNALAYKGNVRFIVCLKESDTEGNVLREFNTTVATLPVLEGLEVDASYLGGELYDVLEQLQSLTEAKVSEVESAGAEQIAKVSAKSAEEQENIANKGAEVLATIPEDYQTTYKLANEGVRTKADAIVCSAIGEVITVTDSSDDNLRGLSIFGKSTQVKTTGAQIFDASRLVTATMAGVTITNNADGSFTISGDSTLTDTYAKYYQCTHEETLILISAGSLKLKTERITNPYVYAQMVVDGLVVGTVSNYKNAEEEIDILQEWIGNENSFLRFGFFGKTEAGVSDNVNIRPMVYQSGDGTWEPYTGGIPAPNPDYPQEIVSVENPVVSVRGKNLVDITKTIKTASAITVYDNCIKVDSDNSYAATSRAAIPITYPLNTPLTISYDVTVHNLPEGLDVIVYMRKSSTSVGQTKTRALGVKTHHTITINGLSEPGYDLWLYIRTTTTTDSVSATFENIQVEVGTEATEYDRFKVDQSYIGNHTLHAIPVASGGNYTDSDGQQWICDEIDFERGVYISRISSMTLVNNFQLNSNTNEMFSYLSIVSPSAIDIPQCICTHFPGVSRQDLYDNAKVDGYRGISVNGNVVRIVDNTNFNADPDGLNDWISTNNNFKRLMYVRAHPLENALSSDEIAAFQALRSNYPNTTVLNDSGVTMKLIYNADTETWIKNLIDERIATAIANIQ